MASLQSENSDLPYLPSGGLPILGTRRAEPIIQPTSELSSPPSSSFAPNDELPTLEATPRAERTILLSSELSLVPSSRFELEDESDEVDDDESEDGSIDIVEETLALWERLRNRSSTLRARGERRGKGTYTIAQFMSGYISAPARAKKLSRILLQPDFRETIQKQGVIIQPSGEESSFIDSNDLRTELQGLISEPAFASFDPCRVDLDNVTTIEEVCSTEWLQEALANAYEALRTKAPKLVRLISQILQGQKAARSSIADITEDSSLFADMYLLASVMTKGYARNISMFLRQILGLYLIATGTTRRVIEILARLGIIASYNHLNKLLNNMALVAENRLKKVAHDPNGVIVYDNFNFANRVQELAGGKQDHFVNLTTACLVACPSLNGPLSQKSLNLKQHFTKAMVLNYLMPRKPSLDAVSQYLVKFSIKNLFKLEDVPAFPEVQRVTYSSSPYLQIGAIFEDEGTIDGVYRVHEELWQRRLEFKEYDDRLTLVYGDQKTTSFIRRIKQSQSEASEPWERKKWMLPVPALFHIELNYIEMLFRVFWDTGDSKTRSSAVISADVEFFQRGRHINKRSLKYHQTVPLLIHGFTARILALLLRELRTRGYLTLPDSDLNVDTVKELITTTDPEILESVLDGIWTTVFTKRGWTGRYEGTSEDDVDKDFRSHCRLMQAVEILLTIHEAVRKGEYGVLRDVIPQLPILFWGGRSSNYGPEMLYFAWLLHESVSDERTRDAILQGGLVRCVTAGSGYKSIDIHLEHINAGYALDIKNNKNSTHDIRSTFSRLALNGNYLAVIRKSVDRMFGARQKGTHTSGDATIDIISYACKLFKDGLGDRKPRPNAFDVEDIYARGQRTVLEKLPDFNVVVPEQDEVDQPLLAALAGGATDDAIDWSGEGQRQFDDNEADNFWGIGLGDLGNLE
ncbi:hypothetical protein F4861DRAFT_535389 [Xylaria intraflava]|nr:hypothetical protein F4861DRAFT_535389 [Xylaria intraflava]